GDRPARLARPRPSGPRRDRPRSAARRPGDHARYRHARGDAYFLHLSLKTAATVVVVGAQRPATGLSSDAGLNLLNAVRVAAAPEARGLGVLVLLNDEIQTARDVTKTSTLRLETFRSPDLGMLGYADPDGRIAIYRRPSRRHAPDTEFDVRG